MGNPTPKAPTRRQETYTGDPANPCPLQNTQLSYISKETKNGTPTVKWHYRVTIESSSGENRHPLDQLRTLANNLEAKDIGLQLFHRHRGVREQAQDITRKSDPYAYCTSITGLLSKLTTLQLSVTPDKNTILNSRDPLKKRMLRVSSKKWSFYPDKFLGN